MEKKYEFEIKQGEINTRNCVNIFNIHIFINFLCATFPQSHRKYVKGYFHPDVSKNKIHFGKLKGDWQCYRYIHMIFHVVWCKNNI